MHKIPEDSDKHRSAMVGLLAGFFACADKHRRGLAGGGGVGGCCGAFECLDPPKDRNDLLLAC